MDIIEIDITTKTKTVFLNKAIIWVRQIKLFEYAIIDVRLTDLFGSIHETHTFKLEGQEYLDWRDDKYLIDWIKLKLI